MLRRNIFNRWTVLFFGIAISFILLMAVPEENIIFRSIFITLTAVISIGYYLYKRYSRRLAIQSDLLISINTFAQFLLPVFYLTFYYQANPELDIHGYRYGYPIVSFAALLGQTMFFLGYEKIKKSLFFPQVKIIEKSYFSLFLMLMPLLTFIWIARFVLLSTGSYYHIYRTDYQFTSPYYSIFAQLSKYGLIIIGVLFLIAFSESKKRKKSKMLTIAIIVFILELLWYVPCGAREAIVLTILVPIISFVFIRRTIPKKIMTALIISSFPVLAILGVYRYVSFTFFQPSKLELTAVPKAIIMAKERLKYEDTDIIAKLLYRLYDGRSLGYLLLNYSNDYDYELGNTYKNIPFILIPRFIYTNKPIFTTALNKWYKLQAAGSMPTTFWGEAYINFSWLGIVIMSYILGLGMKYYDYIFIKRAKKPYWVFLYIFSALHIIRLPMQVMVIWVSFLLKVIVLAFLFTNIHSILTKIAGKSTFILQKNQE